MEDEKVKQYYEDPEIELPIKHSKLGFNLTSLTGHCLQCGVDVETLRGTVNEWPSCLEIRCAGICKACNVITPFEFRWTEDKMIHKGAWGWKEYPIKHSLWNQIKAFFGFASETTIKTNNK